MLYRHEQTETRIKWWWDALASKATELYHHENWPLLLEEERAYDDLTRSLPLKDGATVSVTGLLKKDANGYCEVRQFKVRE